jgi:hypothetical protein
LSGFWGTAFVLVVLILYVICSFFSREGLGDEEADQEGQPGAWDYDHG